MRRKLLEGRSLWKWALFALTTVVVLALVSFLSDADFAKTLLFRGNNNHIHGDGVVLHTQVASGSTGDHILKLPEILLRKGIYSNDSFVNEAGVVPAYWQGEKIHHSLVVRQPSTSYGPCYSYDSDHPVDWEAEIAKFNSTGEPEYNTGRIMRRQPSAKDLQGYCRPGFIIIGMVACLNKRFYSWLSDYDWGLRLTLSVNTCFLFDWNRGWKVWNLKSVPLHIVTPSSPSSFTEADPLL